MIEHYVTLFDRSFLPQGLALHASLMEHGGDCLLWVLCLDQNSYTTLQQLDLPQLRLIRLQDQENPQLLAVKSGRSQREYCWTLTPWSIQWVFELEPSAARVTYIDADIFFLASPAIIFTDFDHSGKHILITEHGYSPEYDQTRTSGLYCVQFLTVRRGLGEPLLHWWRDSCIKWCFHRAEDGKYGDQKYIEEMAARSPSLVHVSSNNLWFQAPWNASTSPYSKAVIYHFHGLRIETSYILMWPGEYAIPSPTISWVYIPYCQLLLEQARCYNLPLPLQAVIGSETTNVKAPKPTLRSSLKRLVTGPPPSNPIPRNWYSIIEA